MPSVIPSPALGALRLLLVETGELLERTFANQGYGLTRVTGRGDALATVKRLRPVATLVHLEPQQDNEASFVRAMARATIAPVLLVTVRTGERRIVDLLKAEAAGLLFEEDVATRLVGAIPELVKGGTPLSNDVSHLVMARARRHSSQLMATAQVAPLQAPSTRLAGRKREILGMLAKGLSYDQIGVALDISVNTVRSHVREIYSALEVTSKVEAVMVGIELGLISREVGRDVSAPKLALLVAEFNRPLVDAMLRSALDEAKTLGAEVVQSVRVPGSYETPLAAEALLRRSDVDALVVLGYIERGETQHGEVMGHVVHRALVDASLRHTKPVGLGFIGPGALPRQAAKRKDGYARSAVRAAVRMLEVLAGLRGGAKPAPARTRSRRR